MIRGGHARFGSPDAPPPRGETAPCVLVPVRGSSVVTGLERTCRAKLVGFAAPIGRLSAVLRISDPMTGNFATSVVPVEWRARTEGATAELTIPQSDVRARELRAETEAVRLVVCAPAGTLLGELLTSDFDCTSAHRQALLLTTALHRGALATA